MRRGEVWWAELEGDAGFRPVVIVTPTEAIGRRYGLTIAEVTRVVRGLPSEVELPQAEGMPADSVINTDNLHTIPKDQIRHRVLTLNDKQLFALAAALRFSLGLEW